MWHFSRKYEHTLELSVAFTVSIGFSLYFSIFLLWVENHSLFLNQPKWIFCILEPNINQLIPALDHFKTLFCHISYLKLKPMAPSLHFAFLQCFPLNNISQVVFFPSGICCRLSTHDCDNQNTCKSEGHVISCLCSVKAVFLWRFPDSQNRREQSVDGLPPNNHVQHLRFPVLHLWFPACGNWRESDWRDFERPIRAELTG